MTNPASRPSGPPRSQVFRADPMTREEQECGIGRVLLQQYEALSGVLLTGNRPSPTDPPDWLFEWRGISVGAEMFEVPRFYGLRALQDDLTNRIYAKFELRGVGDRYLGMTISILDGRYRTDDQIKAAWAAAGVKSPLDQTAIELVDLVMGAIRSREDAPPFPGARYIRVDHPVAPALSEICTDLCCIRSAKADIRRSDGVAAPLVVFPGIMLDEREILGTLVDIIQRKVARRITPGTGWSAVRHAVLVAHDLPRGLFYMHPFNAVDMLMDAVKSARLLDAFDEFLFVTCQEGPWQVIRIAGGPPISQMC